MCYECSLPRYCHVTRELGEPGLGGGTALWGELHKILRHKAVDLGIPVTRSVFAAPGDVA